MPVWFGWSVLSSGASSIGKLRVTRTPPGPMVVWKYGRVWASPKLYLVNSSPPTVSSSASLLSFTRKSFAGAVGEPPAVSL